MPPTERGQATVELVALLPCLAAVLAVAWQLALAGHATWAAAAAARAAARASAVGSDPAAAARAHLSADLERGLTVEKQPGGAVVVGVRTPVVVPGVSFGRVHAESRFAAR